MKSHTDSKSKFFFFWLQFYTILQFSSVQFSRSGVSLNTCNSWGRILLEMSLVTEYSFLSQCQRNLSVQRFNQTTYNDCIPEIHTVTSPSLTKLLFSEHVKPCDKHLVPYPLIINVGLPVWSLQRNRKIFLFILSKYYTETPKFVLALSSVQTLSHVRIFVTPWTAPWQDSLSISNTQNLLKLISTESVMPSNHPILYRPRLLLPLIPPRISLF